MGVCIYGFQRYPTGLNILTFKNGEVFKTNVNEPFHAELLIKLIHRIFNDYNACFDLEDCDKVLRVESSKTIEKNSLMNLIQTYGFEIEILSDNISCEFISNIISRKTV